MNTRRLLPKLLIQLLSLLIILIGWANPQAQEKGKAAAAFRAESGESFKANDEIPETLRTETFLFVWAKIRDNYFDPAFGGVDWEGVKDKYLPLVSEARTSAAYHGLLRKMLGELRASHLAVLAPHELKREKKLGGETKTAPEGVEFRAVEGRVTVYRVKEDSPSWAAGLRPGQIVLKVGDVSPAPAEEEASSRLRVLAEVRRALAGEASSPAVVKVLDESGREKILELPRTASFHTTIDLVNAHLEYSRLTPLIGYIRFDSWAFDLESKLKTAMTDLWDMRGLIIDLRQNRGGVNPGADYLTSVLIAEPGILASIAPRSGEKEDWKFPGGGAEVYKGRVAILIDEGSGSVSEVFAGAMQEMGRAIVLGRTSYGGVLNSTQALLPTGGILQFPHSDMRTPQGRRIEGVGVVPDIAVELSRRDLLAGKDTVVGKALETLLET